MANKKKGVQGASWLEQQAFAGRIAVNGLGANETFIREQYAALGLCSCGRPAGYACDCGKSFCMYCRTDSDRMPRICFCSIECRDQAEFEAEQGRKAAEEKP